MALHRLAGPLLPLVAALVPSCSMKQLVADNMTGLLEEVEIGYLSEPSYQYGREAGAGLLKTLDGVIASSPNNEDLLFMGARMNAQFALAFIEDVDDDYARSLYGRAFRYGLRAIDDDAFTAAVDKNAASTREVIAEYEENDVPLLFWTGMALGGWIDLNKDSISAVADAPIAVAIMERVIELDESFFFGGAHLFLGRYYGSRGPDLGGDPERSREHFERAIELTGGTMLLAKVYLARYYATLTQNRALFEELCESVLDAPGEILPGQELATAVAKHKADQLLFEADDYFLE